MIHIGFPIAFYVGNPYVMIYIGFATAVLTERMTWFPYDTRQDGYYINCSMNSRTQELLPMEQKFISHPELVNVGRGENF